MKTVKFTTEKKSQYNVIFRDIFNHQTERKNSIDIDSMLFEFQFAIDVHNLPIKCGRGGSHIWVSDSTNDRMIIVEFK